MNTTIYFKYKNKYLSTPNLEKKLKRMGITKDDIEIIEPPLKKKEETIEEESDLEKVTIKSSLDNMSYISFLPKGYRPPIKELVKKHMWNPITKTGIKEFTEDYIKTLCYTN